MPPSAMLWGLPSKTYRSSADNSLSTFSYFMEPVRPVTASTSACHARSTASTTRRQYVSSCPDSLYAARFSARCATTSSMTSARPSASERGSNAVLLGDGRDFRIAHAAHTPPQPVEHTPFLVLSQKPVQAVVHHVLVHPHFRRACCTAQIVRHEVHRAGSGIVHPLQTRRHLAVKLPDMLGKFLKRLNHPRIGGVGRPFSERVRHPLHRGLADTEACGRHSGRGIRRE